ncbi:hypothetical protein ScPMuIL_014855 [Solemya velum]
MAPTATPASTGAIDTQSERPHLPKTHTWHGDSSFRQRIRHPWEDRKALSEAYEGPYSGREGWWRKTIRETPIPGSYESFSFLKDLDERQHTYRFKSDGRKIDPDPHGKGAILMPGAYEHSSFLDRLEKKPATYNFRAVDRSAKVHTDRKDKDINVCPSLYQTEKHLNMSVERQPSRHFMFRSQTGRFPTLQFRPREGPAPGDYDYRSPKSLHGISSSFKSKTPRFSTSHTKVPGPGMYEKTFQFPMSETMDKMGRQHGLFFSSAFQA